MGWFEDTSSRKVAYNIKFGKIKFEFFRSESLKKRILKEF